MMIASLVKLFALAPSIALAQYEEDSRNLTIALYPSEQQGSCEMSGSGGITLTTETIPRHHTCIDVEAIFGGDDRVGFLNDTLADRKMGEDGDTTGLDPEGIHWYISSEDGPSAYDSSKNWSSIWFRQLNDTDNGRGEGKVGRWFITTYANSECIRANSSEFPWFTASCQTPENGTCEQSPYSIKSIKINRLEKYDYDSCPTWAELDVALTLVPRASVALVTALAAVLLM